MRRVITILAISALVLALGACAMDTPLQTVFDADLTHEAEVPPPTLNGADPSGTATATLDPVTNTLVVEGSFSGLTGPATGAHIHGPAEVGEPAGVVFPLTVDAAASGDFSGTWEDITAEEIDQLRDGLYYINVHTELNGPGEIRGQLE